jgi:hypothetical protein
VVGLHYSHSNLLGKGRSLFITIFFYSTGFSPTHVCSAAEPDTQNVGGAEDGIRCGGFDSCSDDSGSNNDVKTILIFISSKQFTLQQFKLNRIQTLIGSTFVINICCFRILTYFVVGQEPEPEGHREFHPEQKLHNNDAASQHVWGKIQYQIVLIFVYYTSYGCDESANLGLKGCVIEEVSVAQKYVLNRESTVLNSRPLMRNQGGCFTKVA